MSGSTEVCKENKKHAQDAGFVALTLVRNVGRSSKSDKSDDKSGDVGSSNGRCGGGGGRRWG